MTKSILTEEQKAYLLRIAPNRFNKEITLLINNKFKTNFTENQIKHYKKHNKIKSFNDDKLKEIKSIQVSKYRKVLPIGSETVWSDGFIWIKVKADPAKWRLKHHVIWEEFHKRKIPQNYVVIFLDGNKRNFDIKNLELLSKEEYCYLNNKHIIFKNSELTKSYCNLCKLMSLRKKRKI